MVRVATELREAVLCMLQVGGPDNPVLPHLIDSYRDIARELGQQGDVERMLRDLLPSMRSAPRPPQAEAAPSRRPARSA